MKGAKWLAHSSRYNGHHAFIKGAGAASHPSMSSAHHYAHALDQTQLKIYMNI